MHSHCKNLGSARISQEHWCYSKNWCWTFQSNWGFHHILCRLLNLIMNFFSCWIRDASLVLGYTFKEPVKIWLILNTILRKVVQTFSIAYQNIEFNNRFVQFLQLDKELFTFNCKNTTNLDYPWINLPKNSLEVIYIFHRLIRPRKWT